MNDWKEHTKINIPEVVDEYYVENIDNPMMLWIELNLLFSDAAKSGNENLIKRIFEEADYYHSYENNPKGDDYSTAVALAFIEHLIDEKEKISYVLKYFPKEDFIGCKELLTYHNNESKYQKVLALYN
jgi:hypothetical protein